MVGRYRLTLPTLGIVAVDGHHESIQVPVGTIVDLDGKTFNGERIMDVIVNGRKTMIFTQDLKRGSVPA